MSRSDNSSALWLLLGVGAVAYLASRSLAEQISTGDLTTTSNDTTTGGSILGNIVSAVRGIRNNNPGNIRRNATQWQGLAATQNDSSFFQFESMAFGIRAIGKILMTYQNRGLDSVQQIVSTWAPANENDTAAYIDAVASRVGVASSDALQVDDPDTLFALIRAIIRQENGVAANLIPDATVRDGVNLALTT